jgi:hypothetical protein
MAAMTDVPQGGRVRTLVSTIIAALRSECAIADRDPTSYRNFHVFLITGDHFVRSFSRRCEEPRSSRRLRGPRQKNFVYV